MKDSFRAAGLGLLLVGLLGLPLTAQAWGTQGHQVVANLAQARLSSPARREVERLLALEPGETLASVSTWADKHRSPKTAAWHYVNFPCDSCHFVPERECPDGKGVVYAIDEQLQTLTSQAPAALRLTALKYLVHLVADVHQPLHAGYLDDKGGNTYQRQAFMRGSNLHALRDSGLIRYLNEDTETMSTRLLDMPLSDRAHDVNVVHAAQESCRIVGIPELYPDRKVGLDYNARFTPTMEQRLPLAGARLAHMLNRAFK
ncbi:MAG: S1/P1 nuclease [Burkholderiaceae bacterium]|nr:S1/P1 nuclease [Burkholderiaceae bacterium]